MRIYEATARGLRRSANSGHPIGQKNGTPMTGLKVQRP
jgi:hypothetical protein